MNKTLLFFSLIFFSYSTFAGDFCARTQGDMRSILSDKSSRISFKNSGGLFNGGVCWWHSRFQRSSAYLVQFRPAGNRPSLSEVKVILSTLRAMNKTVVIPGYSDFETFSHDYKNEIQSLLNDWQKKDGFFNFEWMRGISGKFELEPAAMRARMDNVYNHYKNSPTPLWIMAQIKGITSHSLLILKMAQTDSGYILDVIDSNHPQDTVRIEYNTGDRNLRATGSSYSFVPYVGFQNDFVKLAAALKTACGGLTDGLDLSTVEEGDVELPSRN